MHRAANAEASPFRFVIEPREQLQILDGIESADLELGAIYHSHTRTAPEPSQTDINFRGRVARRAVDHRRPRRRRARTVRTWRIDGGEVAEEKLDVA